MYAPDNAGQNASPTGLAEALVAYRRRWPAETSVVALFEDLLADPAEPDVIAAHGLADNPYVRERLAGHLTASSWLVDRSGRRVLLTHHRKLGRWLQLGGHADGDVDLGRVALREAEEESGLEGLTLEGGLFDLDRHWIPVREDVPGHWHYDVRYVVRAGSREDFVVSAESLDLAWRDIEAIADDSMADASLRRMSRKWLQRD